MGKIDEAIEDFSSAINLDPNLRGPITIAAGQLIRPAQVFMKGRAITRAIADYGRLIYFDQRDAGAYNGRCWNRALANRELKQARADCDMAIKLASDPDAKAFALDSRGLVHLRQKRHGHAWKDYDAAVRTSTSAAAGFYFGRGISALRLGRTKEGEEDIAKSKARSRNRK